jgi:ribonuclease HI
LSSEEDFGKKRIREANNCCASGFPSNWAQLPTVDVTVADKSVRALLDTGCSRSIISRSFACFGAKRRVSESVVMMNGELSECQFAVVLNVVVHGMTVVLDCLVADVVPGYDLLLGMDGVKELGGVEVCGNGSRVTFLKEKRIVAMAEEVAVHDKDFSAIFKNGAWTVEWKWLESPPKLHNRVSSYRVPQEAQEAYDQEIAEWIRNDWLVPFEGDCDGVIPLMAVVQVNKAKVRPVMDYRELNQFVSSHTADGDVCGKKLRAWRRLGENVSIIDLRKAYLQIHVEETLWKYQVIEYKGRRYCLTRLGFGLNVAPKIMTKILHKVLSMDKTVDAGTDSYIDDIIVDNAVVSNERVLKLLEKFGLEAKPPESLVDGRVLGLRITKLDDKLMWKRDNKIFPLEENITRRRIFAWCGQLLGHFPVASWLRPACSFVKRQTNGLKWDQKVGESVIKMARDIQSRVEKDDPVRGEWVVSSTKTGTLWCDASSLAIGVCLEIDGSIIEDATWLRKQDDATHINVAELESIIKGLSIALEWNLKEVEILTDSSSVNAWLQSLVNGDKPVKVRGLGEVLTRRRLSLIEDLIKEHNLKVKIGLVRSCENKADVLTRVPRE